MRYFGVSKSAEGVSSLYRANEMKGNVEAHRTSPKTIGIGNPNQRSLPLRGY